ncbi:MAG: penicillin acylase family protein [Bacteroidetes bacterium]|nr:penicillin acylase family protein [Bacteroidota bacterium]
MKPLRLLAFLLSLIVTTLLAYVMNTPFGKIPAWGKFFSPHQGFWQQAEPVGKDFNLTLPLKGLKGEATVYLDERLVPHVYAEQQEDAVFVQGYLHARFRLWQMEFQTHAAAGRISEIIGEKALDYDRQQRRLGMGFAAENMLREMEADPMMKKICDAYTAGVNAYIDQLSEADLPLEYKLLSYHPERWNNLKIALFVKAMTKNLSAYSDDLERSMALSVFTDDQMKLLFPDIDPSLDPIIPKGTLFTPPTVVPQPPADADSVYLRKHAMATALMQDKPDPENGSNNWAIGGSKTKTGAPMLCNDPHLKMSLPSVWYEMEMSGPDINVYGSSFPGIPGIVIGFNDHIAWGVTNSERDVMDHYEIRFKDEQRSEYWYNGTWKAAQQRIEKIGVKGSAVFYDTVAYTVFGPVIFDDRFPGEGNGKSIAVRWKAHDPSNEAKAFWLLNHAKNYADYENAIKYFECPGQNFVFAAKNGDIALWQQGAFPAKWNRQGLYVMPGWDSSYLWQGEISHEEHPHDLNPARGFVASGNQRPVDSSYPYFIPGSYYLYRGLRINRVLEGLTNAGLGDMMRLQNDNYNGLAGAALPHLLSVMEKKATFGEARAFMDTLRQWNLNNDPHTIAPTLFTLWYDSLEAAVYDDELGALKEKGLYPAEPTLIESVLQNPDFVFIDNVRTPEKETWDQIVAQSFRNIIPVANQLGNKKQLVWKDYKNTTLYHLLGPTLMPLAVAHLPVGGGKHVVNAIQHDQGPSWKMIVDLSGETSAYVVYPGGQNGNPGSPYYQQFVDTWSNGRYYKAWVYKKGKENDAAIKWKMHFQPAG